MSNDRWYFIDSYASRDEAVTQAQKHRAAKSFGDGTRFRVRKGKGVSYAGSRTPWVVEWQHT